LKNSSKAKVTNCIGTAERGDRCKNLPSKGLETCKDCRRRKAPLFDAPPEVVEIEISDEGRPVISRQVATAEQIVAHKIKHGEILNGDLDEKGNQVGRGLLRLRAFRRQGKLHEDAADVLDVNWPGWNITHKPKLVRIRGIGYRTKR